MLAYLSLPRRRCYYIPPHVFLFLSTVSKVVVFTLSDWHLSRHGTGCQCLFPNENDMGTISVCLRPIWGSNLSDQPFLSLQCLGVSARRSSICANLASDEILNCGLPDYSWLMHDIYACMILWDIAVSDIFRLFLPPLVFKSFSKCLYLCYLI